MDANEIRNRIGSLIIDEAFSISQQLYKQYEKIDQYIAVTIIGCLCKLTNVILNLRGNAVFDAKDFADNFVYDGMKTLEPAIESLYDSEEANTAPMALFSFYEHLYAVKYSHEITKIAYTCNVLLDRVKEICVYKPDKYNEGYLCELFAEYTDHLHQIIISTNVKEPARTSPTYRSAPPAPAKKSSGNGFRKFLIGAAIVIIIYLLFSKGVL